MRTFERFYLALLSVSAFGLSSMSKCNDYNLKIANNDGLREDWHFHRFADPTVCLICLRRTMDNNRDLTELVLPCMDPLIMPTRRQVQIEYRFRQRGTSNPMHQDNVTLSIDDEEGTNCQHDYISATNISRIDDPWDGRKLSNLEGVNTVGKHLDPMISYRLKIQISMKNIHPGFIVCLTNVTFNEMEMLFAATPSIPPATSDGNTKNQGSTLIRVGSSAAVPFGTAITTMKTQGEQGQSYFPIWVIFVIIAIVVISICAVAGVFIRRRKHHDHQLANNVNTGKVNGPTSGIKDNMKNDKDVIPNPTYGQEPVNEKEDEYHSYTEIDVKVPGNTEMIYNSAYESPPASSGMVYNSAYESEETNNDMIYNSAYESSPSN